MSNELLAAVDVVGRAGDSGVGHQVHGERGDVGRPDHAPDGQRRAELIAAVVEVIAEQPRRQGRVDEPGGDEVDPDRRYRIGAGRHHDVFGGVARAVDLDHARPGQLAGAADQVDALARQPALLPGIGMVRDDEVTPGQGRLDVDLRGGRRLACPLHRLAGPQERLGRDARPVRALPAGQLALDHRYPQAAVGQRPGAVLARRAGAQHDDVIVAHAPAPCTLR